MQFIQKAHVQHMQSLTSPSVGGRSWTIHVQHQNRLCRTYGWHCLGGCLYSLNNVIRKYGRACFANETADIISISEQNCRESFYNKDLHTYAGLGYNWTVCSQPGLQKTLGSRHQTNREDMLQIWTCPSVSVSYTVSAGQQAMQCSFLRQCR